MDTDGSLYIAAENTVQVIYPGQEAQVFASGFEWARGVAFDVAGNLYVADDGGNNIVLISGFPHSQIEARVLDAQNGMEIAGVNVRVTLATPPFTGQYVITGLDGTFLVPVAPGTYNVTIWREGYVTFEQINVRVNNEPTQIILEMTPAEN